jgi:nucleoside-diphosphate-sugar epimerase
MKIFVSGATGFIGRAFCQVATLRGHRILALTRDPSTQIAPNVKIATGSLAETPWSQVAEFAPDAALHLAWIAEPGVYLTTPENDVWLEQSQSWFQRLFDLGVPYVVGMGTCIEYAASGLPMHETRSALDPAFPYSRAKTSLFNWLQSAAVTASAGWSWMRLFYPYGPGEHRHRICSSLIKQLRAGQSVALRTPGSIKDYIYIEDAARIMCQIVEARLVGPVNVGTGSGTSIQDLATLIAQLLNADTALVQHAVELGDDPTPVVIADIQLLQNMGFEKAYSLETGLRRLIDSLSKSA